MVDKTNIKNNLYFKEMEKVVKKAGSRSALAEAVGVTYSCVSNWVNDNPKFIPSMFNCYMMEKLYGANQKLLRGNLIKLYSKVDKSYNQL